MAKLMEAFSRVSLSLSFFQTLFSVSRGRSIQTDGVHSSGTYYASPEIVVRLCLPGVRWDTSLPGGCCSQALDTVVPCRSRAPQSKGKFKKLSFVPTACCNRRLPFTAFYRSVVQSLPRTGTFGDHTRDAISSSNAIAFSHPTVIEGVGSPHN